MRKPPHTSYKSISDLMTHSLHHMHVSFMQGDPNKMESASGGGERGDSPLRPRSLTVPAQMHSPSSSPDGTPSRPASRSPDGGRKVSAETLKAATASAVREIKEMKKSAFAQVGRDAHTYARASCNDLVQYSIDPRTSSSALTVNVSIARGGRAALDI